MKVFAFFISLMYIFTVVSSYTAIKNVPNVSGKCKIKGDLIASGETYFEEEHCESWICRATSNPISLTVLEDGTVEPIYEKNAKISVIGCGVGVVTTKDGKRCRVGKTKGKYPECCNGPLLCS